MNDPIEPLRWSASQELADKAAIRAKTHAGIDAGLRPGSRPNRRTLVVAGLLVAALVVGGATAVAIMAPRSSQPAGPPVESSQAPAPTNDTPAPIEPEPTNSTGIQWEPAEVEDQDGYFPCPARPEPDPPLDCYNDEASQEMKEACERAGAEVQAEWDQDDEVRELVEASGLELDFPDLWASRNNELCNGISVIRYDATGDPERVAAFEAILEELGQADTQLNVVGRAVDFSWAKQEAAIMEIGGDEWLELLEISDWWAIGPNSFNGGIIVRTSDPIEPRRATINGIRVVVLGSSTGDVTQ